MGGSRHFTSPNMGPVRAFSGGAINLVKGDYPMRTLVNFLKDESGATAAEYALLVAFIAVVIIGGATLLGNGISGKLSAVAGTI